MRGHWWKLAAGALAASAAAGLATAADLRAGDDIEVTGAFDQMLLAAGDRIRLAVTAADDVAAAGGDVEVDGSTADHIFLAGGDLAVLNSTVRDVFAAGGEIDLVSGQITDDFVAAGGRIKLASEARVDGDVVVSGGDLRVESPIGGELRAAGGRIYLSGAVVGDVFLDGGRITIGPDAHIQGSLTHRGRTVTIDPGAQIDGQTIVLRPRPEPDLRPLAALAAWAAASVLFGLFLMAVVLAVLFPRLMDDTAGILRRRPLSMLGLGVLIAIAAPILTMLLAVTLIGLPLAFVAGAAFTLLWPVAIVGTVYAAGMLIRLRTHAGAPAPGAGARALWAGLGMIIFIIIGLVPVVGFFAWLLAWLIGLGGVVVQASRALSRAPAAA